MTPLFEQIMNKLDDLTSLIPSEEVEGESVSLTSCAGVRPKNLKIKGDLYQNGTPTPDAPIDVEVLTGDVEYDILEGEVITDFAVGTIASLTGADNDSITTRVRTNYYIEYTDQKYLKYSGMDKLIGFCYDADKNFLGKMNSDWDSSNPFEITVLDNTSYIRFAFTTDAETKASVDDISNVILYNSLSSYPLSLGELELCGDDTYGREYLYKKDGKWYKHQIYNNISLNGSENWVYNSTYSYFHCDDYTYEKAPLTTAANGKQWSTHFAMISSWASFRDATDTERAYYITDTGYKICIRNLSCSTVDDLVLWLSENNVKIYYMLNEELDIEITDATLISQLEKICSTKLIANNTAIATDNERCIVDLTYYYDIETLING